MHQMILDGYAKEMIGMTKLVVEPIGNHYRIVVKGTDEPMK